MAVSIIPRVERGRLYFQTADLLVPTLIQAACGSHATESHRGAVASVQPELRAKPQRRRCGDCQLHLTGDVLRATGQLPALERATSWR